MKAFLKRNWQYVIALLVPLVLILVHCATRGVWVFGERSLLRGDANIQYIYLFEELWNKVHNGDFSSFSWNALGGFDFYLNALYYTISPATIIILLLPKSCIHNALQFFMVLKWMLMSVTVVYFFMNTRFNRLTRYKKWVSLVLGLCYAMGNYSIAIIGFFNWLDTLILFPVLLLLVERMITDNKWKLYYLLLTVSMLCNFYIAFPICIFLFLWFVLQIQLSPTDRMKKIGIFIGSSMLSAITAMGVIVPCVTNVSERYILGQQNQNGEYLKSIRMSLDEWIQRFFLFDVRDVGLMYDTPFYFSIGIILVSMLFVFIKMNKREKWNKIFMLSFIIVSFFVGVLNYIWHGFSIPHGIDQRYTFVFYIMICIMALDVIYNIEQIRIGHLLVVALINIALFVYTFFNVKEFTEFYVYLSTILVFAFCVILVVLYCRRSIKRESFLIVFLITCILEVCANAYLQLTWYDTTEPGERYYIEDAEPLLEELELEAGERVVFADTGYNLGLKHSVPNMSGFVSYSYGGIGYLGMYLGAHVLEDAGAQYMGLSPIMNYMFNVQYGIGVWDAEFSDAHRIAENGNVSLYEMEHESSIGYMVKSTATEWEVNKDSVWKTQNQYVEAMLDEEVELFRSYIPSDIKCYTALGETEKVLCNETNGNIGYMYTGVYQMDGGNIHFTVDRDMDLYVNFRITPSVQTYIYVNEKEVLMDDITRGQSTIHIGKVKKGDEVSLTSAITDAVGQNVEVVVSFAEFDQDKFEDVYKKLSKNLYNVTEMQGNVVKGTIVAEESGIMMTSIPAMKGFTVYVDGEQTECETIGNALIGVPLEMGQHEVEFRYETQYAKIAWLFSFAGFVIFSSICGVAHSKKKHEMNE